MFGVIILIISIIEYIQDELDEMPFKKVWIWATLFATAFGCHCTELQGVSYDGDKPKVLAEGGYTK